MRCAWCFVGKSQKNIFVTPGWPKGSDQNAIKRGFEERVEAGQFHKNRISGQYSICICGSLDMCIWRNRYNRNRNKCKHTLQLRFQFGISSLFFLACRCENVVHFLYRWISVSVLFLFILFLLCLRGLFCILSYIKVKIFSNSNSSKRNKTYTVLIWKRFPFDSVTLLDRVGNSLYQNLDRLYIFPEALLWHFRFCQSLSQ